MSARTLVHSARLITGGTIHEDAWVLFAGDTVAAVGDGAPPQTAEAGLERVDAAGKWLVPGFIDIHCHGAGGAAFDDGQEAIRSALAVHRSHGTTRTVLSLVTAELDDLAGSLASAVAAANADPLVLGAHLEGPFLDVGHKGAHNPQLLRSPTPEAIDALLAAGEGRICQVTLAPELDGGVDAVHRFVDAGVVVAVGHTAADYETARAAFNQGASILTHAFNGMDGIHHRAPGPVAAATHTDGVTLEVINDGTHVHPEVVRIAFASAPGRIALITDAMAATGSSDGVYMLGSLSVTVTDGVARLTGGTSIAGSTLTQDTALRLAVTASGLPIESAVDALTAAPARAISRADSLGSLAPGYAADAVLLDEDLAVETVWAAGSRLR